MLQGVISWVGGTALAALCALPAWAAGPPQSLRDALFGDRSAGYAVPAPPVARYRLEVGESFVLDRLGRDQALLKFEGGSEVWVLKGVPGAHGDMIFKNDIGEPMMRATRFGGVTLFTTNAPQGMPAALEGGAQALRAVSPIGPEALLSALARASVRASRSVGRGVFFDAPDVTPRSDWLFADTAQVAAEAFARTAAAGRRALGARFSTVRIVNGRPPAVAAQGPVIRITVDTDRGLAGRPSSRKIALALGRR